MAKRVDPAKAKQRKQIIMASIGGLLLLALLAFQVPRVLKQLHKKPPVSQVQTTTIGAPIPGTPALVAPTLGGSQPTPVAGADAGTGALASAGPTVEDGQLASFSRFATKDPFSQQLVEGEFGTPQAAAPAASGPTSGTSTPTRSFPTSSGTPSSGGTAPAPGTAVISVNGTLMSVTAGSDFPQPSSTDPSVVSLFHLVSLTATTAKISIVGGGYSSGAGVVTIRVNKPVTLMNTADGTRYRIILKPQGTAVPGAAVSPSASTTPTVTLPNPKP